MESNLQTPPSSPNPSISESNAPVISVKDWVITILLLAIPIVNLIMLFVWAFGGGANPSKANYAKASLIWILIGVGIYIIFFVLIFGALMSQF